MGNNTFVADFKTHHPKAAIDFAFHETTAVLKINRPQVYNALRSEDKLGLAWAITKLSSMNEFCCLILTGEGKAFCTGQDISDPSLGLDQLKGMPATPERWKGPDIGRILEDEWLPIINAIMESKKIIIAAMPGVAAGAGISVALASDLIVVHPESKWVAGFSKIGLCPDAGITYFLTQKMGPWKAKEFFMLNRPIKAHEAEEWGLVNEVSENPLEAALNRSHELAKMPKKSLEVIKSNCRVALDQSFYNLTQAETLGQRLLGDTYDYREGVKAFLEKRPAVYQGK